MNLGLEKLSILFSQNLSVLLIAHKYKQTWVLLLKKLSALSVFYLSFVPSVVCSLLKALNKQICLGANEVMARMKTVMAHKNKNIFTE